MLNPDVTRAGCPAVSLASAVRTSPSISLNIASARCITVHCAGRPLGAVGGWSVSGRCGAARVLGDERESFRRGAREIVDRFCRSR